MKRTPYNRGKDTISINNAVQNSKWWAKQFFGINSANKALDIDINQKEWIKYIESGRDQTLEEIYILCAEALLS